LLQLNEAGTVMNSRDLSRAAKSAAVRDVRLPRGS
jgi:hypothetical protein